MKLLLATLALCLAVLAVGSEAKIQLQHLSTVYLPYSYKPSPIFKFDKDAAEQSAYDPVKKIVYTVGNDILHAIDVSNPRRPRIVYYTMLSGGEFTDIETCGDYVAMAFDNKVNPLEGKVFVYSGFDRGTYKMKKLHSLTVGALPDMLKFTSDCSKIVVALEGELRMLGDRVIDPEGGVAIISFCKGDPSRLAHVKQANFTKFNNRAEEYVARGVRWVYRGEGTDMTTTFSQDLEPEYITINCDDTIAYIGLEENNAMATVDLVKGEITEIYPLGSKNWQGLKMDVSDKDGGIHLKSWPLRGLYQPDGIKYVVVGDNEYIITANEGEEKEYEKPDFPFEFSDGQPGKYFVDNNLLDDSVPKDVRDALADESQLGRLRISTQDGRDPTTGKIRTLYTYGGRSFSVWDANTMSLVYDSGDEVERRIAENFPEIFSSDGQADNGGPESSMDSRSRKKGPETETFDFGEVNGKNVLFVANERPGTILIYSFSDDMTAPVFESAHYAGGSGKKWNQLYKQRLTRDIDPEDVKFIPASSSPNGKPMLVVSGTTSGTVSLYKVTDRKMSSVQQLNVFLQNDNSTNSTV